jgi:hypothetical protein
MDKNYSNGLSDIKIKALNRARTKQLKQTLSALPNGSEAKVSKFLAKEITKYTPISDVSALHMILDSSPSRVRHEVPQASISSVGAQGRRRLMPMLQ